MKIILIAALVAVTAGSTPLTKTGKVDTKAASSAVNCGCQCAPLTFRDKYGRVHGNCKTADDSGAKWCYVPNGYSTCSEFREGGYQARKFQSQRFSNRWSYEACATPELTSPQCSYYRPYHHNQDCIVRHSASSNICTGISSGSGVFNTGSGGINSGYNSGYNSGSGCRGRSCGSSGSGYNSGSGGFNSGCRGRSCGYNSGSGLQNDPGYNSGSGYGGPSLQDIIGNPGISSGSSGFNSGSSGFNSGYNSGLGGFNSGYNSGSGCSGRRCGSSSTGGSGYNSGYNSGSGGINGRSSNDDRVNFGGK